MREKLGGSDFFQINDSGNKCAIDRFEEYSIAWTLLLQYMSSSEWKDITVGWHFAAQLVAFFSFMPQGLIFIKTNTF